MSDYMNQYENDYDVHCYSDDEIMKILVDAANEKIEDICSSLEDIKDIKTYRHKISNIDEPQTGLRIYKIKTDDDEIFKQLVGVVDVTIDELNSKLKFSFYSFSNSPVNAFAEFINGEWGDNDGIPTPIRENDFSMKDIDNLIIYIFNMY